MKPVRFVCSLKADLFRQRALSLSSAITVIVSLFNYRQIEYFWKKVIYHNVNSRTSQNYGYKASQYLMV